MWLASSPFWDCPQAGAGCHLAQGDTQRVTKRTERCLQLWTDTQTLARPGRDKEAVCVVGGVALRVDPPPVPRLGCVRRDPLRSDLAPAFLSSLPAACRPVSAWPWGASCPRGLLSFLPSCLFSPSPPSAPPPRLAEGHLPHLEAIAQGCLPGGGPEPARGAASSRNDSIPPEGLSGLSPSPGSPSTPWKGPGQRRATWPPGLHRLSCRCGQAQPWPFSFSSF